MIHTLRPATAEDIEWLDPFYERIMRPYVELTHDWHPTVFRENFRASNSQIIQVDGRDVGLFKKEVIDGNLYLWDIQLDERYRGHGIGSRLIEGLKDEALALGIAIRLRVLKGNPAIDFYRRHGFTVLEEQAFCHSMEWRAGGGAVPGGHRE